MNSTTTSPKTANLNLRIEPERKKRWKLEAIALETDLTELIIESVENHLKAKKK